MTITEKPTVDTNPVDNGVNVEALLGAREALTQAPPGGRLHMAGPLRLAARHPQPDPWTCRASSGSTPDVRNGFSAIRVSFDIDADATDDEIKALVA